MTNMETFDLEIPADVFVGPIRRSGRQPMVYLRFATGAAAIRHVIEAVKTDYLLWASIETDEGRIEAADIKALYDCADFPRSAA